MEIMVFVSSHCPHCPKAVSVANSVVFEYNKYGLEYKKVRVKTTEGKYLSGKYHISAYPTILMLNDDGDEIKRIVGVPSKENLKGSIEKMLGLKKPFFGKFW